MDNKFCEVPDDLEFTRRVRRSVQNVVRDPYFRDSDYDLIFELLKDGMSIVPFGDYLKRYIYTKSGMSGRLQDIPREEFVEIICAEFADRRTPCSFTPTTKRIRNAARNWLEQQTVSRNVVFLLGFGLGMSPEDVNEFLTKALKEPELNAKDPFEAICWYCYQRGMGYLAFEELWNRYQNCLAGTALPEEDPDSTIRVNRQFSGITDEAGLFAFLSALPIARGTKRQSVSARRQFDRLYLETRTLIAKILTEAEKEQAKTYAARLEDKLSFDDRLYDYQKLRRIAAEKGNYKAYSADDITPADLEDVILSAVPKDEHGNLTSMNYSALNRQFYGKRLTRQHLGEILSGKAPVTRYDLLTLYFFVYSQTREETRKKRYTGFIESSNRLLDECNFGPLYVVNPYECFLLMCMLTDDPLGTDADVWELSYDQA